MQPVQRNSANVLVVMLKAPVAGKVKTRLVPSLSPKEAARLYRCFIEDIFSRISILKGIDIVAAVGTDLKSVPRVQAAKVKKIAPPNITIIPQKGKELGERLQNIFSQLFSIGYKKVAIIGTDSPDLPIEYIKKSFSMLKGKTELILGPAQDGGYYLIAMSKECDEILKDIPWSTDAVFENTIKKAKKAGLKTAILPKWYDVDDIESLKVLRDSIKISPVAPKTGAMLKKIFSD